MASPFHVIRRLHLDRRTFLRGSTAAVALPWLDAMHKGIGAPPQGPTRTVFIYSPNGMKMDDWTPQRPGRDYELPLLLQPLAKLRAHLNVYSHLGLDAGRSHGDGPGDHARSVATYLTAMHPRKTGGKDLRAGVSIDQLMARHLGKATEFPSLELGMEGGRRAGICDSGYSCAYSNNVSWRTPSEPVAKESNPRAAFARLFGQSGVAATAARRERKQTASVLDAVLADANDLRARLGNRDRDKLDGYLTSVRDFERRLDRYESADRGIEVPEDFWERKAADRRDKITPRLQLMYDIIKLALEADRTRIVTFMLGNGGSNRSYRFLGVPEGHHSLSHHRNDPNKLTKIGKINRYHVGQFARFLESLQATEDGDRNLLHRSMVLFGSGLGDGNRHNHLDLPILLAGHGNGRIATGSHIVKPKNTPLANLYVSMLAAVDIQQNRFADSTGTI